MSKERRPRQKSLLAILFGLLLISAASPKLTAPEPVGPKLAPHLRELLVKEMTSVRQATHGILDGLVTGDDATVAKLAQQVHDSFVMEQSMTPRDRTELEAALPKSFVQMDESFHRTAAKLAEAARVGDRVTEQLYFDRMTQACATCHARFATDVFPEFARKRKR